MPNPDEREGAGGSAVLNIDHVSKSYAKHDAVSGVSFDIRSGETVGLLGPNGSGKTTILHMIVGLLELTTGSIDIAGRQPSDVQARRMIGFVPDDLALPTALTGDEFLKLHESLRGVVDEPLRDELVTLFNLGADLHRAIGEYSHGMRRKLQLVAAASHRPQLLVLDEPHRGFDPESSITIRELIAMLRADGTAVLVATHDLADAARSADRVAILHRGSLLAVDSPEAVCLATGSADLESSFLRLTGLDERMSDVRRSLEDLRIHRPSTPFAHTSQHHY